MEGKNELNLCQAEMIKAMQQYIDHLMPAADASVTNVKPLKGTGDIYEFVITLKGNTKKEDK